MPWSVGDVDQFAKGLSDAQKKVWVSVANSTLARCKKNGGSECDGQAIKQATFVAKGS